MLFSIRQLIFCPGKTKDEQKLYIYFIDLFLEIEFDVHAWMCVRLLTLALITRISLYKSTRHWFLLLANINVCATDTECIARPSKLDNNKEEVRFLLQIRILIRSRPSSIHFACMDARQWTGHGLLVSLYIIQITLQADLFLLIFHSLLRHNTDTLCSSRISRV